MIARTATTAPAGTRHPAAGLLLVLCLLWQGLWVQWHHAAAAQGVEVCTAMGMVMVMDAPDGHAPAKPVHGHDQCCSALLGPPATAPTPVVAPAFLAAPAAPSFTLLSRDWLGPLSRGPPQAG